MLTRRVRFAAAHRYHRPDWSDEKNREVFGACSNPHGHGHNYRLDVTVQGPIDPETGFVMDLGELDRVLGETVMKPLDHQHLNHAVAEFGPGGLVPTCENIAAWLWPRIRSALPAGVKLHSLRLHEDDDLSVELTGGSDGVAA